MKLNNEHLTDSAEGRAAGQEQGRGGLSNPVPVVRLPGKRLPVILALKLMRKAPLYARKLPVFEWRELAFTKELSRIG